MGRTGSPEVSLLAVWKAISSLCACPDLLRTPSHIGLGPTLVTLFHLHHLISNIAPYETLGIRLQHVGLGGMISLTGSSPRQLCSAFPS